MLFLLKRKWGTALLGLMVLGLLGVGCRLLLSTGPDVGVSAHNALLGLGLFTAILVSDGIIHVALSLAFGEHYLARYRDLARLFGGQTAGAMLAGAAMAGVGEELLFRGISIQPSALIIGAAIFGAFHHVGRRFWPFTIWSGYQGLLLAAGIYFTEALFVTMIAHFLHDLCGFLIFRWLNRGKQANNLVLGE